MVDKYTNSTTVPNWNTGVGGTISPYQRPNSTGLPTCASAPTCDGSHPPCNPWLKPYPGNTFAHTPGDKVDLAVAHKRGFKNVFSRRFWQGRCGYKDAENGGGVDTIQPCSPATSSKMWLSYQSSPKATRYTRINASASWQTENPVGHAVTSSETASCQETIDPHSGIGSPDSYSVSPNESFSNALAQLSKAFWRWGDIISFFTTFFIDTSSGWDITWTATSLTASNPSNPSQLGEQITWDLSTGTFTRTVYNFISCSTWGPIWTESVTVTDTTIDYEYASQNGIGTGGRYYTITSDLLTISVTGTLSNPVTSSDIWSDSVSMLNLWNLADDEQYPFRTDNKVSIAPLVSRDETVTNDFSGGSATIADYSVPIADVYGNTIGDEGWDGRTGVRMNPNPQTGTALQAIDFPSDSTGAVIDIQVPNPFSWCAATSFTVVGGSFPSGVSMDSTGHITGTVGDNGHWGVTIEITGATAQYSGDVLGGPNPAGYQDYFSFNYSDYDGCCYDDGLGLVTWNWYQKGWGKLLSQFISESGAQLPLNCTQWTNYWQAQNKPIGAFAFYNDPLSAWGTGCSPSTETGLTALDANALWLGKYCEIIEGWPSQNFARPAGNDKFSFDETMVYCATNVSGSGAGSVWALTDPTTGAPPALSPSGYWGGTSVGGFYAITAYNGSTGHVTLGAKQYDVPSNWASRSNGDDSKCFGILRFDGAPSLLGRAAITTTDNQHFTFATAQPAFGMNSSTHTELCDFYDANMTLLAGSLSSIRTDDTHFFTPITIPAGAAFVQIHGAAKYYFNDNSPKGDYTLLEFLSDFRSQGEWTRLNGTVDCSGTQVSQPSTNVGGGAITLPWASFTQTAGCLPFVPCAPKVICISPNGETFPNGRTFSFPGSFSCDNLYGSKWWAQVHSIMTDLLWQPPHFPCNLDHACDKWVEDDGTCHAPDGAGNACPTISTHYYEFPPQVEARLSLPGNYGAGQNETAPALPTGIQIGWLSPVTHAYGTGDVAFPIPPPGIGSDGSPNDATTPWGVHQTLCLNVSCAQFDYTTPQC